MGFKKGIAHTLLIILIAIAVLAIPVVVAVFVFHKRIPLLSKKAPNVALKTEYKNPFDKKTQYVNPFEETKNPFANLNE